VSVVIQRLVDRKLVAKRREATDRRRHRLEVTARGRRVLQRAPAAVQQRLIAAIAQLPAADRRVLADGLSGIARDVGRGGPEGHPPMLFEDRRRPARRRRDI
jgi:DNA-binding MarR family transcriptional regulator